MTKRYKIETLGGSPVLDIAELTAFEIEGRKYPRNWLRFGGTIPGHSVVKYDVLPPVVVRVIDRITKLQLVRALRLSNQWGGAKTALAQADTETKEDWEFAYYIYREDAIVVVFAQALSLTSTEVDALFAVANTL